ncbi:AN1-type zinc finger protein 1 [Copidosoma floridanum]|uniref:AN1-type zinc finger protein 1 n=1 Tax=Copidosoma floridanum TaxID=29053 RepID=UPI0006C989B5|nr:AN1-type zinc finger protein 1 [Copidosoma floridanum]
MEFPSMGDQCSIKDCQQLDFLPFTCNNCQLVFCKIHFTGTSHPCSQSNNVVETTISSIATYKCSQSSCTTTSVVEMLCIKCNNHFCLLHRHHGCFEPTELEKQDNLIQWEKPKQQFTEAKDAVDKEIMEKLKKSKNSSTSIKIKLMKLKAKAKGLKSIPATERCYFLVHPPMTCSATAIPKDSRGVFVSINWTIGKVIDSITDTLNIPNFNNQATAKKLRFYNYYTGVSVSNQMDEILSKFINDNRLINGQEVILEYSDSDTIEPHLYK